MIDIIIPVYNSSKTLEKAILSISKQKDTPKINVYIIDDNSSEDYSKTIKKYEKKINIKYVKLNKNVGPGLARDYGLNVSKDKYIIFLDSDDTFFDKKSLSTLYNAITKSNSDVVRSVIYEQTEEGYDEWRNENIGLHGKIYRRKFLKENDIHFNETRSNEDTGFNLLIELCGANYYDIDDVTYIWSNNQDSITRKNKENYKDVDSCFYAYNICWAIKEAVKRDCNFFGIQIETICLMTSLYYKYLETDNKEIKRKIKMYAKEIYGIISENTDIPKFILENDLLDIFDKQDFIDSIKWVSNKSIKQKLNKQTDKYIYETYNDIETRTREEQLKLMNIYNNTDYEEYKKRENLRRKMFASIGDYSELVPPFQSNWGGKNLHIGEGCYINFNFSINDDGNIFIGDNVFIGPNVNILTVNHPVDPKLRLRRKISIEDVHIEDNVWIGAGSIILPGVTIGANSVIGAGSIVTKDIPTNVLAIGNPCKVIKEI